MERLRRIRRIVGRLHRDERGANMVEYILIIAAIALPLLALLFWFRGEIAEWIGDAWERVVGGEKKTPDEF